MPKTPCCRTVLRSGEVWSEIYLADRSYILDWKRAARFSIAANGSRMRCRTYAAASPVSLAILRDLAGAYARSLRGEESFHATALIPPGRSGAIGFLGDSGAGKSTLSAFLVRRQWRLLSDDAMFVNIRRGSVLVSAGAQRLKLSEEARDSIGWGRDHGTFDPNLEKWVFGFGKDSRQYPLLGLLLLSRDRSEAPRFRRIHGADAALVLQSSYYNVLLRPQRVLRRQFNLAARLAGIVPIWDFSYPSGLERLPEVCNSLESFVAYRHAGIA